MSGVHSTGRVAWEVQPNGAINVLTWLDLGWQTVVDGASGADIDIAGEARRNASSTWAGFHRVVDAHANAEAKLRDMDIAGVDE